MPIATGKISLRSNTANKSNTNLLTAIMNFLVNSGNYTLITNQITASSYFVVQSTRETGFVGDKIIAQIGTSSRSYTSYGTLSFLYVLPYESWSGTTGTNAGVVRNNVSATAVTSHYESDHTWFSLIEDTDLWISCNDTFILMMNRFYGGLAGASNVYVASNSPTGVVAFERLSGDNDTGTFYGHYGLEQSLADKPNRLYVPKRFDGATASSALFNLTNMFGGISGATYNGKPIGLYGVDESGSHVGFDTIVHLASSNRVKGRLYGVKAMPIGKFFGNSDIVTGTTGARYMIGKYAQFPLLGAAMEVAPTITNLWS